MKKIMNKLKMTLISEELDFRIRLFNIMALSGALISFFTMIQSLLTAMWMVLLISFIMCSVSLCLFFYAIKSGKYQRCYDITIVLIFMIFFHYYFFKQGDIAVECQPFLSLLFYLRY